MAQEMKQASGRVGAVVTHVLGLFLPAGWPWTSPFTL